MKCHYCDLSAFGFTQPPLCEQHFDLAVLTEHLAGRGESITVETVQALLAKCQANGGNLTITAEDVARLMAEPHASTYRIPAPNSPQTHSAAQ